MVEKLIKPKQIENFIVQEQHYNIQKLNTAYAVMYGFYVHTMGSKGPR